MKGIQTLFGSHLGLKNQCDQSYDCVIFLNYVARECLNDRTHPVTHNSIRFVTSRTTMRE